MTVTLGQAIAGRPPVSVAVSALPYPLDWPVTAIVQRSTDGVRYTTVRGLAEAPVTAPVLDSFGRVLSGEWGDADTEQEWQTSNAALSTNGTAGLISLSPGNGADNTLDVSLTDFDLYIDVDPTAGTGTGAAEYSISARISNAGQNLINFRSFGVIGGAPTVGVGENVGGVEVQSNGTTSISGVAAGAPYRLRVQCIGSTARIKGYAQNAAEPLTWGATITGLDSSNLGAGPVKVTAFIPGTWSNTPPVVTAFSNLRVVAPGPIASVDDWETRPDVVNTYRAGLNQEIVATFRGITTGSWPAPDTGQAWDAADAAFNASAGFGTIVHAAAPSTFRTLITTPTDISDFRASVTVHGSAASVNGDPVQFAMPGRYVDSSNFYDVNCEIQPDDTIAIRSQARFAGVTNLIESAAVPVSYNDTKNLRLEVDITGHRIRARLWDPVATPRPDWQIDSIVPTNWRIASGKVGLSTFRSASNSNANFTFSFRDFIVDTGTPTFLQTGTITPSLYGFWLVSTMRSFLNVAPQVVDFSEPSRLSRGGSSFVSGRSLPIGRAELMQSREFTLTIRCASLSAARMFEYLVASGDILYLQTPADCPIPYGYYRINRQKSDRVTRTSDVRYFDLSIEEQAAPGPDIVTAQSTWDTVIALYGGWPAVVAANASWDDVKALIGDPSEVIVE